MSLRQTLDPQASFESLARKTQRMVLSGLSHAQVPYAHVVKHINPTRRSAGSMHDTTFQFRAWADNKLQSIGECGVNRLTLPRHGSEFGLSMEVHPDEGRAQLSLTYDVNRFSRNMVLRFLRHYRCLISNAVRDPAQTVARLAMLEEQELHSIMGQLVGTEDAAGAQHTIQSLVRRQAAKNPRCCGSGEQGRQPYLC